MQDCSYHERVYCKCIIILNYQYHIINVKYLLRFYYFSEMLQDNFLVHLDQRSRWTIAITWRPSSVNFSHFKLLLRNHVADPVGYSIWLPGPIICSDWLKFQRSSSPKLMNWLNPNCKGMIIGMSFTKLLFFMPIGNPRWPPSQDID